MVVVKREEGKEEAIEEEVMAKIESGARDLL